MRRIVGSFLVFALAFAAGCSDSGAPEGGAPGAAATVQARAIPQVWADILAQRDRIQAATAKGTDMWHEDCAEVGSAAVELDRLALELVTSASALPVPEPRLGGVGLLVSYLQSTSASFRGAAVNEEVGSMPAMMIGLDALLQGLESHLTREELGPESVVSRPGFNPVRPPPPPSPI